MQAQYETKEDFLIIASRASIVRNRRIFLNHQMLSSNVYFCWMNYAVIVDSTIVCLFGLS